MRMNPDIQDIINELEDEGYEVRVRRDKIGDIEWVSACKCSGYSEEKSYRTFRCKKHMYIPEFEEEEEEEEE